MIRRLTCVDDHRQDLLYCDYCSTEKIMKYSKSKHSSKEFFEDLKKNLIQHFATESQPNGAFKNCVVIDYFTTH